MPAIEADAAGPFISGSGRNARARVQIAMRSRSGAIRSWSDMIRSRSDMTFPHIQHLHDTALPLFLLIHQLLQRNCAKMIENKFVEPYPQVVRHAFFVIVAIFFSIALRRIDRLVNGKDNLGNRDLPHISGKAITATRTSHAIDKRALAQLGEQLLKIR